MDNEIKVLVQMQKFDDEIGEKEAVKEQLPKQLSDLQEALEHAEADVKRIEKHIESNFKDQKSKELEIKSNNEKVAKYSEQQNLVKTNKEYKALNSEIDHLKKMNQQIDDNILELMENEGRFKEELKTAKKDFDIASKNLNDQEDVLKKEIETLEIEVQHLRDKRNVIAKTLPVAILKRYAKLIKTKNRKAVVYNENNSCSGCGFSIRPQLAIELAKGERYGCENCGRIIVDKTFFDTL